MHGRRRRLLWLVVLAALVFGLATSADAGTSPVGGKYDSYAYLAVSRSGPAVYVNALIHQDSASGTAASPNRTVYLQRQLSGHWQNVLSRATDAAGRFTVGYLSAPSFSYRLVALPGGNAWGATSGTATSPLLGGVLHPGQSLVAGSSFTDSVRSPSEEFRLTVEPGGAFGIQQDAYVAAAEWTISVPLQEIDGIPTTGRNRLTMQADGDLVMTSATGKPLWISHTSGAGNSLYIQDDGNLVMYDTLSRAVWATHTTAMVLIPGTTIPAGRTFVSNVWPQFSPGYIGRLAMQRDGNLVLFGKSKAVWSSNTHIPGSHAAYTVNGTLAVYSPGGTVLWRSPSYGPISAVILDCGSLDFHRLYQDPTYFPHPGKPTNC
jgi:hypothetical protein